MENRLYRYWNVYDRLCDKPGYNGYNNDLESQNTVFKIQGVSSKRKNEESDQIETTSYL